jgi:hypothetical protein
MRLWLAVVVLALVFVAPWAPSRAGAQVMFPVIPKRPYARFVSVNVDGGVARGWEPSRWSLMGAASAGLGLYDALHLWSFDAGIRGLRGDQRAVTAAVSRTSVESGLGVHAGPLWDLGRAVPGAAAGFNVSVVSLEGDVVFDSVRTRHLLLFVRIPAGFLAYLAFGGQR